MMDLKVCKGLKYVFTDAQGGLQKGFAKAYHLAQEIMERQTRRYQKYGVINQFWQRQSPHMNSQILQSLC